MKENSGRKKVIIVLLVLVVVACVCVSYVLLTKKTVANDEKLVERMNAIIVNHEKGECVYDVIEYVHENGYAFEKVTPTLKGNHIVYDYENNCFVLLDSKYQVLKGSLNDDKSLVYMVVKDEKSLEKAKELGCSIFLATTYVNETFSVSCDTNIDAGNNEKITIIESKGSYIRTNGQDVIALGENVKHYGVANSVEVNGNNYEELGKVGGNLTLRSGRAICGNCAYVFASASNVKVNRNNETVVIVFKGVSVEINGVMTSFEDQKVIDNVIYLENEVSEKQLEISKMFMGLGTKQFPFLLGSVTDYQMLVGIDDLSTYYFKQIAIISLPEDYKLDKEITIDLNTLSLGVKNENILGKDVKLENGVLVIGGDLNHEHKFNSSMSNDGSNHYYACSCGAKKNIGVCTGGKATCVSKAKCGVCGKGYGQVDKNNHKLTHVAKKEATYTKYGVLAHDYCSWCGKNFIDGIERNSAQLRIEKLVDSFTEIKTLNDSKIESGNEEEKNKYRLEDSLELEEKLVLPQDHIIVDLGGNEIVTDKWIQIEGNDLTLQNGNIKTSAQIVCNYAYDRQTTELSNCTLTATTPRCDGLIVACPGTLELRDCYINITNTTRIIQSYNHGGETDGNQVVINIYSGTYLCGEGSCFLNNSVECIVNIYGGTFSNVNRVNKNSVINVYGGTFYSNPETAGYNLATINTVASGYHAVDNQDGTWTVVKD